MVVPSRSVARVGHIDRHVSDRSAQGTLGAERSSSLSVANHENPSDNGMYSSGSHLVVQLAKKKNHVSTQTKSMRPFFAIVSSDGINSCS